MKKLYMAVAATAFVAVGAISTESVQAALLGFNFTTNSGGVGTFTLNTDTPPSTEPALFRSTGLTGILYPNAISNFSFSADYINLSNLTSDWVIAPSITSDFIGFPANQGVLSGANYPSGCILAADSPCLFNVGVLYTGNLSELPKLSSNPNSYFKGSSIDFVNTTTRQLLKSDNITNFQVVLSQPIPESNSVLSILVSGIVAIGLLLKPNKVEDEEKV